MFIEPVWATGWHFKPENRNQSFKPLCEGQEAKITSKDTWTLVTGKNYVLCGPHRAPQAPHAACHRKAMGEDERGKPKLALHSAHLKYVSARFWGRDCGCYNGCAGIYPGPSDQPYCQRRFTPRHKLAQVDVESHPLIFLLRASSTSLLLLPEDAPRANPPSLIRVRNRTCDVFPFVWKCSLKYTQ